jgi:hypothetical protein
MLSNQVRECLLHAEECMQQALAQTDLKLRRDYLIITACWLKLGDELSELAADFPQGQQLQRDRPCVVGGVSAQAFGVGKQ